jgi:hypothetical protein
MSIIQWFSFLVTFLLMAVSIKRTVLLPDKLHIRLPIIFLAGHILAFYSYLLGNHWGLFSVETFLGVLRVNDWSSILRLHSILTFLTLEIYGYARDKTWKPQA